MQNYKCPRCNYTGNKTSMTKHYNRKVICNDLNKYGDRKLELVLEDALADALAEEIQMEVPKDSSAEIMNELQKITQELRELKELITKHIPEGPMEVPKKNFKIIIEEPKINRTGYKYTTLTRTSSND